MPKSIYVQFLSKHPNSNLHYLNRLVNVLNHFISIEPEDKPKGFECHHIVPKSWKPEWHKEPDNLLKVPAKAHYIIHHLMWKAFPEDIAMSRAFWFLSGNQKQRITAGTFERLKSNQKHSDVTKQKIGSSNKRKSSF